MNGAGTAHRDDRHGGHNDGDRGDRRDREGFERALSAILPADRLARDVPMREHTSFRIGGPADFLATAETAGELGAVFAACRRFGVPSLVLGRGTNLLVRDGGIRGVVIRLSGDFLKVAFEGSRVTAGAAVPVGELSRACGERGLAGLEFAIGIPGSVGGAVIMNAGAYDHAMAEVVEAAGIVRPGPAASAEGAAPGERAAPEATLVAEMPAAELGFGYRTSRPQAEGWVVAWARFKLAPDDPAAILRREEDFTARRLAKQPLDLPSAGSVFKRPPGHFAGALIDQAGCRGLRVGDAQISELHAGFIVNLGSATACDVLALISKVKQAVLQTSGVRLEPEIRIVGEDPS